MKQAYEERIGGERFLRQPPTPAHEKLVARVHRLVAEVLPLNSKLRLLAPRTELTIGANTVRPDLALIRVESGAHEQDEVDLYLVAEILQPGDHHVDTVIKKQLWAEGLLPRLWMIDPRYLNVEVYSRAEYGFTLQDILANHHPLTDPHLPGLSCPMRDLFADAP